MALSVYLKLMPTPQHLCMSQEVPFSRADACLRCYEISYNAFPRMDWPAFCQAYSESPAIRTSFTAASKIYDKGEKEQGFRVRGSVANANALEVSVSKQFMALTHEQVLQALKVPPESFEELRFVTLTNENGDPTVFYLFDMEAGISTGNYRVVTFASHHQLVHEELLVEPQRNLRKEQPVERYHVCAKAEVESRQMSNSKGILRGKAAAALPLMTLAEARSKAAAIIEAREAHEAAQTSGEADPTLCQCQWSPCMRRSRRSRLLTCLVARSRRRVRSARPDQRLQGRGLGKTRPLRDLRDPQ